jgi:hypothetical protein
MMNDPPDTGQAQEGRGKGARDDAPGLCARCGHLQVVTSARGSRFYLCRLSFADPAFPRYPPIPVLACAGFDPADRG